MGINRFFLRATMMERFKQSKYPGDCSAATHMTKDLPADAEGVCLHGYLVELEGDKGVLLDAHGKVDFTVQIRAGQPPIGDIVELHGRVCRGVLLVDKVISLVKVQLRPWELGGDWQRFNRVGGALRQNMLLRDAVLKAIRNFFADRGFLEVETPTLVRAPGQEVQLEVFETKAEVGERFYLATSPEHHMKRLLGSGFDKIFQICKSYRKEESSKIHNPEFTMLEWYRAYANYEEIIEDLENLVSHLGQTLVGGTKIAYRGTSIELKPPWRRLTLHQAFNLYADLDLDACKSRDEFYQRASSLGFGSVNREDSWEEIFFKVLLEKVEPALGVGPVFLKDYPSRLAALAKLKENNTAVAERVEAYVAGLELANGFTELNDPREQRLRFMEERRQRRELGLPIHPLDEEFLSMLQQGMPPAGGIAVGLDRLLMLFADAASIDEVIAFPL